MFQQELLVENGIVKIVNKKSEYDANRSKVLPVDTLFTMDENNVINLGDGEKMLNILVLKNNTDARSGADNDEHLTLKKMIEGRKGLLTDTIDKASAWIHNRSVNMLGYFPLQFVSGKAVNIPGLGNNTTESIINI